MTDLVLINPNNRVPSPFAAIEPPLWAGLIAGHYLSNNIDVAIVDAEAEGLTVDQTIERVNAYQPNEVMIVVMGTNPSVSSTPKMPVTEELLLQLPNAYLTGIHPIATNHPRTVKKPFAGCPRVPCTLR